jgi:predicted Zn-dependent protease with MMP-like domain
LIIGHFEVRENFTQSERNQVSFVLQGFAFGCHFNYSRLVSKRPVLSNNFRFVHNFRITSIHDFCPPEPAQAFYSVTVPLNGFVSNYTTPQNACHRQFWRCGLARKLSRLAFGFRNFPFQGFASNAHKRLRLSGLCSSIVLHPSHRGGKCAFDCTPQVLFWPKPKTVIEPSGWRSGEQFKSKTLQKAVGDFVWRVALEGGLRHFFRTIVNANWERLQALALVEIEVTLMALPKPLRERVEKLPVTFERQPNAGLQADGIEPDTLGLFTGPEFADECIVPMPPQIILFLENLWDFAEGDEEIFRDEIHTTFLHELGHYLGLDEDDLMDRGLE